ncbi:MAG: M48 family metalloprotease [Planctomycetota bacterium]|nr:M48 family metalloprotease [Planctomycetota bacterium]
MSLPIVGCASGPNTKEMVSKTKASWQSDAYTAPTDRRTAQLNAARVLARDEVTVNKVMLVGSTTALVHEGPDATSTAVGSVAQGDAVRVVAECLFIRTSPAGNMSEYVGQEGGDISPTWCKIDANGKTGWIQARALASPIELATSSQTVAAGRMAAAAGDTGKGFSEKVKREARGMKGFGGTPQAAGANYEAADAVLVRASVPIRPDTPADPFGVQPRATGLPSMGGDIWELDAALALGAAEATMKATEPPAASKAVDSVTSLGSQFGLSKADDPTVKIGAEVIKLVAQLSVEYPVTVYEEQFLGRECLAQCIGDSTVLPADHPLSCYVSWVGTRVGSMSSGCSPANGLEFVVLEDDTMNAMCAPGGVILITTGMLGFLESEDELAAVLAHEIGHAEERHSLKAAKGVQQLPAAIAFCTTLSNGSLVPILKAQLAKAGLPDDLVGPIVDQAIAQLQGEMNNAIEMAVMSVVEDAQKGGDQGIETAADLRGLSLCCASGWNPSELAPVLERLQGMTGGYGGASYAESRLVDATEMMALLPCSDPAAPATSSGTGSSSPVAKQARWNKVDELLSQ